MSARQGRDKHVTAAAPGRILEIDGLRGIAASLVLYYHLGEAADIPVSHQFGQFGVSLFFIISGFVITMSVAKGTLTQFIASRAARLYPAYWCAMLTTALVAWLLEARGPSARTIIINLAMFQPVLRAESVDSVYWTLAVELQFYALMAVVLALGMIRKIDAICAVILIWQAAGNLFMVGPTLPWGYPLSAYFYLFALGIGIYRLIFERPSPWTIVVLVVAPLIPAIHRPDLVLSETGFAVLVWLAASGHARFLRFRPLVFVGAISYPLYLIHNRIGLAMMGKLTDGGLPGFLAVTLVVGLAASLIHYGVEERLRRPVQRALLAVLSGFRAGAAGA